MKQKLINFNWIVNNLIVVNVLIKSEPNKRVNTEGATNHCSVVALLKSQKQR